METSSIVPELRKTEDLDRPFSLCGRRSYLIGFQNGLFPDYGWHTVNEMGGVWTHPIKVADGFWVSIETGDEERRGYNPNMRKWLGRCDEFVLGDGSAWVEHRYNLPDLLVARREFIPCEEPAVGIDIHVASKDGSAKTVKINVLVRFDILPVWFSGWPDPVYLEAESREKTVVVHAVSNYTVPFEYGRWAAALGSDPTPESIAIGENLWGPEKTSGKGISCLLKFNQSLNPSARIRLVLAGDHEGEEGAISVVNKVLKEYDASLQRKVSRYNHIARERTVLETPEKSLNDAFLWSKLNMEWLTQTSLHVGTGVVAGHQDFPWYFGGDTDLSVGGLLAAGLHDAARESLRLLSSVGRKMNGRIPHEIITNGAVYSWGHIMETTLFVRAVWDTYLWTGDEDFFKELYPVCRMGVMDYTLSQPRSDGILLMEYEDRPDSRRDKLPPSFVVLGLEAMAQMAERTGDRTTFDRCKSEAQAMRRQIEDLFWVEEQGLYASVLDERNKPIVHFPGGFWPLQGSSLEAAYCGVAEKSRIERALSKIEGPTYTSDWGIYLTQDRNISMPITTGFAAIGEFNYGRLEEGLRFIRMIAKTLGHIMPKALPEYVHPSGDPKKYPISSCYAQLWSAAMVAQGLIWGLLRIEPDAARGIVAMTPRLPQGWSHAEIRNITIGSSRISVRMDEGKANVTHVDGPELEIRLRE